MNVHELFEQALALSEQDRIALAEQILDTVTPDRPDEGLDPQAWERAWGDEIGRRVQAITSGEARFSPAEDVFARIESKIEARTR